MGLIGRPSSSVTQDEYRSVYFNTEVANVGFCNNKIRTSLYIGGWLTPFVFFFKGVIIEEFSKLANFFFLVRPRRRPTPNSGSARGAGVQGRRSWRA